MSDATTLPAAGPELDAEVARLVFGLDVLGITACHEDMDGPGWYVDPDGGCQRPVFAARAWDPESGQYPCGCIEMEVQQHASFAAFCAERGLEAPPPDRESVFGHTPYHLTVVDAYSSDIAAAWPLAEHLRKLGLGVVIGNEGDEWEVEIVVSEALYAQGYRGCYMKGPIEWAICRAAIFALSGVRVAAAPVQAGEGE